MVSICLIWQLLRGENLQDQDLAAAWDSHNSWLSRISLSLLAVWVGVPVVLSMVVEKSCRKWFLPGSKRNSSGLSVLSFVWLWANIQLEILAREAAGSNLTLQEKKTAGLHLNANNKISLPESCRHISDKLRVFLVLYLWFHEGNICLKSLI